MTKKALGVGRYTKRVAYNPHPYRKIIQDELGEDYPVTVKLGSDTSNSGKGSPGEFLSPLERYLKKWGEGR